MGTPQDYTAVANAIVALARQIIVEKGVPHMFIPSDAEINAYAGRAAQVAVDALDQERGNV